MGNRSLSLQFSVCSLLYFTPTIAVIIRRLMSRSCSAATLPVHLSRDLSWQVYKVVKGLSVGLFENSVMMQNTTRVLLLTACTVAAVANKASAQKTGGQDNVACYNVITGRTFSASECDLRDCRGRDGSARQFSGFQGHYGDGYGPCIRPREDDERDSEIDCKFGPGFLVSRGKPVQAFSSPICAEAKVEFRQCLNGTMLGSYQYPNCQ